MLRKKEVYTTITPIPGFIPRQLAIDILHSHSEVITLNPLVLNHKPIKAPRDAASDEYYSTWYEISQRIQYIPGIGKIGSGKISFNGCFHDMPWGLQTHTYAPMNIDIRIKYRIDGNQPGIEPPQPPEIGMAGLGVPADGLYLREDIEIRCNVTMVSFVKAQQKAASKEMVSRIIKKAELLDAGVLQAMIENGKLKTINPADRTTTGLFGMRSPTFLNQHPGGSPRPESYSPTNAYQIPRPASMQNARPGSQGGYGHQYSLSADPHPHQNVPQTSFIAELPGNFYHPQQQSNNLQPPQPSPGLHPDQDSMSQQSQLSPDPNSWRWSQGQRSPSQQSSRPTSMASSEASSGFASPSLDHKGFSSELPTHPETQEEYRGNAIKATEASQHRVKGPQAYQTYSYNPQDYAPLGR
ncbi:nacht and wd40 domain protein [Colletotrichum incanum]|uniref:Nacht and wd40 domain protein n=1 Tax=Colletotrichum incanum TaxID=1573173 RepID=A0A166M3B0_COLIC|nr:nacht and wd40 domain protein [Colletotrichum incanum]OHW92256.1 NACHT and WD40 domain protein [Colletotrichum incanum]